MLKGYYEQLSSSIQDKPATAATTMLPTTVGYLRMERSLEDGLVEMNLD